VVKYWLPGYPCIISFNRHTCRTLLKIIFIFLCFSFPSRSILPRWHIANVLSITRKNLMRTIIVVNHREIDSEKFLSYLINSLHDFYQLNLVVSIILFITHYINISYSGDFFYYSWCSLLKNVSLIYTVKFHHWSTYLPSILNWRSQPRHSPAFSTANPHLLTRPVISSVFLWSSNEVLRRYSQWRGRVSVHCVSHAKTANNAASHWHTSQYEHTYALVVSFFIIYCKLQYRANLSIRAAINKKTEESNNKKEN